MKDKRFNGFIKNKKFVKTVVLINNKKIIKDVFLNIDMSTFAFGFIPSLFRKKYDVAIFILILQILNFFLISFPFSILTNFILTGIASIITAKDYLSYLVDTRKFMPYAIWKDMNCEDEYVEKQLLLKSKRSEIMVIVSSIFIAIALSFSIVCAYIDFISGIKITDNKEIVQYDNINDTAQMKIKNYAVISIKDNIVDSVLILNSNDNNDLDGVIYPGNIQVQLHNTTDELKNLVDIDNLDSLKESFKNNFNIEIHNFIMVNREDKEDIAFYQDLLSKILKVHENDIDNRIRSLKEKYPDLDEVKIKEFYNTFKEKDINISELEYDTVLLVDIVEGKILETLNLLDMTNYEFITVDKSILVNNKEIKSINSKYDEYLKKKKDAENNDVNNNYNTNSNNVNREEIVTPPASGGQTDSGIKPPVNNGQTGDKPQINEEESGESIEIPGEVQPPQGDTNSPDNNQGEEETNPSIDSENLEGNLNISN